MTAPQIRDDLTIVELDGEAVVYDERSGGIHHLNPGATLVLSMLDGSTLIDDLVREIAEAVDEPREKLERQIAAIVQRFAEAGLLKNVRS